MQQHQMKLNKNTAGGLIGKIIRKIGGGDISGIADGTITGAISEIWQKITNAHKITAISLKAETNIVANTSSCYSDGHTVCINYVATIKTDQPLAKGVWTKVATIPEGYTPPKDINGITIFGSSIASTGLVQILMCGDIRVYPLTANISGTSVRIDETYLI